MKRMVERDKNHACVFMWSLGNESGYNKIIQRLFHQEFLIEINFLLST